MASGWAVRGDAGPRASPFASAEAAYASVAPAVVASDVDAASPFVAIPFAALVAAGAVSAVLLVADAIAPAFVAPVAIEAAAPAVGAPPPAPGRWLHPPAFAARQNAAEAPALEFLAEQRLPSTLKKTKDQTQVTYGLHHGTIHPETLPFRIPIITFQPFGNGVSLVFLQHRERGHFQISSLQLIVEVIHLLD